jgi:type I restriction-modification system DNA methylase subunit
VTRERAQSFLTDDHIERIVNAYNQFKDEAGFSHVATVEEIRSKDGSLSIPLYVTSSDNGATVEVKTESDLPGSFDQWLQSASAVAESLSNFFPIELINENVHVESVRDDVKTLVMDAHVLEDILKSADPEKKAKEIEIKLVARLRRHLGHAKFTALGERLEKIKERHEQGFLTSLQFLKGMLELAKEVVEAEKDVDPVEERDRAKEALTELFNEAKGKNTHIIVERIVADIDEIVKKVRFPDWQHTTQGERLVQKELRRTLLKYKLHTDQELFDKAYAYIRQYY